MPFDVSNIDPTYKPHGTSTLLPKGTWRLEIMSTELKGTANGEETYLKTLISVIEPSEYEGSTFYDSITVDVDKSNPKIAWKKAKGLNILSAIGNATGVLGGEYEDLHHKPFYSSTRIIPGTNGYADKTALDRVYWESDFEPKQLGPSGPPAASTAAAPARPTVVASNPAPKPVAGAARPWGKR